MTTNNITIQELIKAIADIQALIASGVESPWCAYSTAQNLGKAYHYATESLANALRSGVTVTSEIQMFGIGVGTA